MSSEQRASASKELLSQLQKQQGHFTKLHSANDGIVRASYVLSHKIAKDTVEVGSLDTLRLESLKLVFQPLHTFLVNKL